MEIIEQYTRTRQNSFFTLPQTTIDSLENALSHCDLADQALLSLQNVIQNGQRVSARTLQLFVDNLRTSSNTRRRLRAFKLLDKARLNQDLSDEAFYQLELVKAAYGLSRPLIKDKNKESMLRFILERSEKDDGRLGMPIDVMLVIELHVHEITTLDIICNITKNQQILNSNILNKLVAMFDLSSNEEKKVQSRLVEIFENVARNNQTLSARLLDKLELALQSKGFSEHLKVKVLSVFVQRVQKGEKVSRNIVNMILSRIETEKQNLALKQELLSSIGSIVLQSSSNDLFSYKGTLFFRQLFCYRFQF